MCSCLSQLAEGHCWRNNNNDIIYLGTNSYQKWQFEARTTYGTSRIHTHMKQGMHKLCTESKGKEWGWEWKPIAERGECSSFVWKCLMWVFRRERVERGFKKACEQMVDRLECAIQNVSFRGLPRVEDMNLFFWFCFYLIIIFIIYSFFFGKFRSLSQRKASCDGCVLPNLN